ncbi:MULTISPECIES: hypothetical protein [unclassified Arthrobacter]|uniref:hypothetical protein n=1 Tax=unclassified Arthrobacter TaxID=235627 RepID=UPI001F31C362|nr:hypothetical protein [Arthrobacter sp. FW305-BF8]UKA56244.1 hypothetical protein LFT45_10235 [Arthrobacter sp. FW305-BF8]
MLEAMSRIGIPGGRSAYFRFTTRPLDQAQAAMPTDALLLERRRRHAVAGRYRLSDHDPVEDRVTLVGVGAIMPEVIASATRLKGLSIIAGVVCLTSPDLVLESLQRRNLLNQGIKALAFDIIDVSTTRTRAPRHGPGRTPPTHFAFLAGARGDRTVSLGAKDFGQSSDLQEAYRIHGIDEASIVNAAPEPRSLASAVSQ